MDTKFKLEIDLGNAAMETPEDVADALEQIADVLRRGRFDGNDDRPIRDANGNVVGSFRWSAVRS